MINKLYRITLTLLILLTIAWGCFIVYVNNFSAFAQQERIYRIYAQLVKQTGVFPEIPPLIISNSLEINANANPDRICIFQGMIDFTQSDDEIALVLGHEIGHITLGHVYIDQMITLDESNHMEANADKMGAIYMMKAGYNICSGRQMWLRLGQENGEYLGSSHPTFLYRYNQLNINCGDEI